MYGFKFAYHLKHTPQRSVHSALFGVGRLGSCLSNSQSLFFRVDVKLSCRSHPAFHFHLIPMSSGLQDSPTTTTTLWRDVFDIAQYYHRRLSGAYRPIRNLEKYLMKLGAVDKRKEEVRAACRH